MKNIKALFFCLVGALGAATVQAETDSGIWMKGKEVNGYNQPHYEKISGYDWKDRYIITSLADPDNFPWSSASQGSVFSKIFRDLAEKEHIIVDFYYPRNYPNAVQKFEEGVVSSFSGVNTLFGVYYENIPYSQNVYIYPSFFENPVHVITSASSNPDINNKEDLKKFRGVYADTDKFSSFVLKDFSNFGIKKVKNFPEAYKQLLSDEADYIVGSYYSGIIEAYKLGIRDYVTFSKEAVWKMPMFFRAFPKIERYSRVEYLKRYLKSPRYKKIRDEALRELVEIYKENTKGVVPPTYIKTTTTQKNEEQSQNVKEENTTVSPPIMGDKKDLKK